jgi:hypothetical protein
MDGRFQYFLNQKKNIAVISFVGHAERSDVELWQKVIDVAQSVPCKFVVLNFVGVVEIEESLNPAIVRLQSAIRDSFREVLICGLHPGLYKRYNEKGMLRSYEVFPSLVEALQKIVAGGVK